MSFSSSSIRRTFFVTALFLAVLSIITVTGIVRPCSESEAIALPAGNESVRVYLRGDARTCYMPLRTLLREKGVTARDIRLEIYKSERLLKLNVNGELVKSYVFGLGGNPDADKTRRGDSATPLGEYYVCQKLPNSKYYLSLKLSYPNIEDGKRGLSRGLISKAQFNRIARAIKSGKTPPMNTKLGGDICIHGDGAGRLVNSADPPYVRVRDWTAGCMAVDNPEMKELFYFVPVGAPVTIYP